MSTHWKVTDNVEALLDMDFTNVPALVSEDIQMLIIRLFSFTGPLSWSSERGNLEEGNTNIISKRDGTKRNIGLKNFTFF
jgi:hypothetical protein